jgi:hypothetical protein
MKKYMLHRPLADMESDGVYFEDSIKKKLIEDREKLICQYSGLPSVDFYRDDKVVIYDPHVIQEE